MDRALLGEGMIDSGVGRTLSSYSQARIRSRSEERVCTRNPMMMSDGFGPMMISSRSKAMSEPITKMHSLQRQHFTDYFSKTDSVFYDVATSPPQSSRMLFSQNNVQQSNCESCHENRRQKVSDKQKRKEKSNERSSNPTDLIDEVNKLQVSPLNSQRLQPTRHRTKTAILTILDNGEVCIEFIKRRNGLVRLF